MYGYILVKKGKKKERSCNFSQFSCPQCSYLSETVLKCTTHFTELFHVFDILRRGRLRRFEYDVQPQCRFGNGTGLGFGQCSIPEPTLRLVELCLQLIRPLGLLQQQLQQLPAAQLFQFLFCHAHPSCSFVSSSPGRYHPAGGIRLMPAGGFSVGSGIGAVRRPPQPSA